MNDNAKKWIKALRSGEYKQGKEKLRVEDTYCCLGVACELYNLDTGEGEWVEHSYGFEFEVNILDTSDTVLPGPVQDWLGLESHVGYIEILAEDIVTSLDKINDNGSDFNFIADFIETHQDNLFKVIE